MCGLTGYARKPDAPHADLSNIMLSELLLSIESRGRHATGIATCGGSNPFIWKWAEKASVVVKSDLWAQTLDAVAKDTPVIIGHTRHATHSNAHKDEAAHPFKEGRVVGAHNGIIYNWREIEKKMQRKKDAPDWIVDSQAAFGALDRFKDPRKALEILEGYFALTWYKNNHLFLARSSEAPLSVCYVPEMLTLFWNSEERNLVRVMKEAGITPNEYELWSTKSEIIYQLDPEEFTKDGVNPTRLEVKLEKAKKVKIHASHANNLRDPSQSRGGDRQYENSYWSATEGREVWGSSGGSTRRSQGQVSLIDLERRIKSVESKMVTLEAENEYLYRVLEENGLLEVMDIEEEEDDSPTTSATSVVSLFPSCKECLLGEEAKDKGTMLKLPYGFVHEKCIFPKMENKALTS